jgi:hypothetical protein
MDIRLTAIDGTNMPVAGLRPGPINTGSQTSRNALAGIAAASPFSNR